MSDPRDAKGEAREADRLRAEIALVRSDLERRQDLAAERERDFTAATDRLAQIENSTWWRLGAPIRSLLDSSPSLRRVARGTLKLAWWSLSLQLLPRLRERRARQMLGPPSGSSAWHSELQRGSQGHQKTIVYLSGDPATPGHLYRVVRPAETARALGHPVRILRPEEVRRNLEPIEQADLLIVWRAAWTDEVHAALRAAERGRTTIAYDIDDLLFEPDLARGEAIDGIRSQAIDEKVVQEHYTRVRAVLARAHFGIAATDFLARRMEQVVGPCFVLPNGFDEEVYRRSRAAVTRRARSRSDGLVRIGYAAGTRTHQKDFAEAASALAEVLRRHPQTRLVLFREGERVLVDLTEFPEFEPLMDRIEWREAVPIIDLPLELARFDVNLAPLQVGNPFCEAKSELKFYEAALVDVPTIASPTGSFRAAMRHGHTGFLAANKAEWATALERLVTDASLRREMGRAAHEQALAVNGPERRAERMRVLLEQAFRENARAGRVEEIAAVSASHGG